MAIPDKPIKEIGWGFGFGGGGLPKAIVQPDNIDASMELIAGATFSADLIVEDFESGAGELIADSVFQGNAIYSTPSAAEIIAGAVFSGNMTETTNDPIAADTVTYEEWNVNDGAAGSVTHSGHTVGTGGNRLLVAVVGLRAQNGGSSNEITSVTWNSNALNLREQSNQVSHATRTEKLYLFDLTGVNVTSGNQDLVISYNDVPAILTDVWCHVQSYENVAAGIGVYSSANTGEFGALTIGNSITPQSENSLIVVCSVGADDTKTWSGHDASLTEIDEDGALYIRSAYSHDLASGASTLNYTETFSAERRLITIAGTWEQS